VSLIDVSDIGREGYNDVPNANQGVNNTQEGNINRDLYVDSEHNNLDLVEENYLGQTEAAENDNITIDDTKNIISNVVSDSYSPQLQVTVDIYTDIKKDSPSDLSDGREDGYTGQYISSEVVGQEYSSSDDSYDHSLVPADSLVQSTEDSHSGQYSSSDECYDHSLAPTDSLVESTEDSNYGQYSSSDESYEQSPAPADSL